MVPLMLGQRYAQQFTPGSPGTWNRAANFALMGAVRVDRKTPRPLRKPGLVLSRYGYTVTSAGRFLPYGASVHASAKWTHLTDGLYIAWQRGRWVRQWAAWTCGSGTTTFRLLAEPSRDLCPMCLHKIGGCNR